MLKKTLMCTILNFTKEQSNLKFMKSINKQKTMNKMKLKGATMLLLLLMLFPVSHAAKGPEADNKLSVVQEKVITGIVKDTSGEPLIGVNVLIKGTTVGTVTDIDGAFSLKATEEPIVLVFSYVGYVTQEIKVTELGKALNITMQDNIDMLDEVVVVGYGVQKKKLVTGATIQVDGESLQSMSTGSVLGAMQSKTPGVNITQASGMPGEGFKVNIRGLGTMGDAAPLYVIDGVPGGNINNLNPSDIESIDVLKDAASAAIYGARAANGVILVTTKQGKTGKLQLSYDGYVGWQNVYKMPDMLNPFEYMNIINEARHNDGLPLYDFSKEVPVQYEALMNGTWGGTNWMEEMRNKNALTQNHSINLNGGNEQSKFSLGLSYNTQEGVLGKPVAPEADRYTFRLNSDHVLLKVKDFDAIKIGESLTYSYTKKQGIGIGNQYGNDIRYAMVGNPLLPIYNSKGDFYDQDDKTADSWALHGPTANPIADMVYQRGQNQNKSYNLHANIYAEIQPIKNLRFRTSFGYKNDNSNYRQYKPTYNLSTTVKNTDDLVQQSSSMGHSWSLENTLAYALKVNMHSFDAVVGQSVEKWGRGSEMRIVNTNSNFPGSWANAWISNTTNKNSANMVLSGHPWGDGSLASFFGRVNYNLNETYMATVIMRADGSSNFARGHRWGYFPSVSAGWVVTNEKFMEPTLSIIDFLKVRASWGQNGNSNIDNFQYLSTIAFDMKNGYYWGNNKGTLVQGGYPNILANPEVTWETSEQLNIGLDMRFLNSRLGVVFDWYNKTTKDWLVMAPILDSYGTGAPFVNGGDVENKGFEVGLDWNDRVSDFSYGVNLNFSYNKNEVTRIANTEGIIHGDTDILAQGTKEMNRVQVGYPIGYFYGYKTNGLFQTQAQINEYRAAGKGVLSNAQPGDVIFVDTNGDGSITDEDKVQIGNPHPKFRMGFSMNFAYKGFDLALTATGAFGHQIAKSYRSFLDNPLQNYTTEVFERWHGEGTSNRYPRLTGGAHSNWTNISDLLVEDADYIKLQNLTFGYDLKTILPKLPLAQARIYFAAQNLFTITDYKGMDPEVGYGYGHDWASGIDVGFYPSPRTYMIGFNLTY